MKYSAMIQTSARRRAREWMVRISAHSMHCAWRWGALKKEAMIGAREREWSDQALAGRTCGKPEKANERKVKTVHS